MIYMLRLDLRELRIYNTGIFRTRELPQNLTRYSESIALFVGFFATCKLLNRFSLMGLIPCMPTTFNENGVSQNLTKIALFGVQTAKILI